MDIDSNLASSSLKRSSDTPDSPIDSDKRPKYDSVQADLKAKLDKTSSANIPSPFSDLKLSNGP